ncbi:hypothetical protein ACWCQM_31835 [Streptomyces sp. NPDC002125]
MDAHSRGRAEEIDPAEQWVLDPRTGNYELRLNHSGTESPGPSLTHTPSVLISGDPGIRVPAQRCRRDGSGAETTGTHVDVLDGGGLAGAAEQTDQGRALADMAGLPATALKQGSSGTEGLQAMAPALKADFEAVGVPVTGATKAPEGIPKASADKAVCAQ